MKPTVRETLCRTLGFCHIGMGCFYYVMVEPGRRAKRVHQTIRPGTSFEDVESLLTGRYLCLYYVKTTE